MRFFDSLFFVQFDQKMIILRINYIIIKIYSKIINLIFE